MRSIVWHRFNCALLLSLAAGCAATPVDDEPATASVPAAFLTPNPTPCQPTVDIVVSDSTTFGANNGGLIRVAPTTGQRTTLSENNNPVGGVDFESPSSIVFDGSGQILVVDTFAVGAVRNPGVVRVDATTGVRTAVSNNTTPVGGPSFVQPTGIDIEAGGTIVVADLAAFAAGNGGVIRVDPATGTRTVLSRNGAPAGGPTFENPFDLVVGPSGDIYVIDSGDTVSTGRVIRVDPVTGARTLISRNGAPAGGPSFAFPQGITMDKTGRLLISDVSAFGDGGIIAVDPTTGARTTVSSNTSPAGGPLFSTPGDLVVESCGGILVTDHAMGAVYRVDPVTGARSVVSDNLTPSGAPLFDYDYGIAIRSGLLLPPGGGAGGPGGSNDHHSPGGHQD
jgi:sugar lactone lactonase YvrE